MAKRPQLYSNEFRKDLNLHILSDIHKGETASIVGLPGVGKSNTIYWLKKHCDEKNSNIILITVDLNNLVSINDLEFYRLLLLELYESIFVAKLDDKLKTSITKIYQEYVNCKDSLLTYNAIKNILRLIIERTDYVISILLYDFERIKNINSSVFNTISALRNIDKNRIVYIFIWNTEIKNTFDPQTAGNLYDLLIYNRHWLKPLNKNETKQLIKEITSILKSDLNDKQISRIYDLSGGHAWLIKILAKLFLENQITMDTPIDEISDISSIISRSQQLWNILSNENKNFIKLFIEGNIPPKDKLPEFIEGTGLINEDGKIFSPLFQLYIEKKIHHAKIHVNDKTFTINSKSLSIQRNGKEIKDQLTKNELKLMRFFMKNESVVISRDEIAEVIWGKYANRKYSDWAIDKIISRLREKIEENPKKPIHLMTLRGLGFKFKNK